MAKVAQRYIAWIERHVTAILIASMLAVLGATYLVMFQLPLRADFSYLLPADAPSVRAAEELAGRMPQQDTMLMLIVAPSPAMRERATTQALAGLANLDKDLMDRVESDDAEVRAFIATHRHLFAPLAELEAARDALATHIAAAKQRANPLFVDLTDPDPVATSALDDMRAKQREAAARLAKPAFVSADGKTQVIVLRTAFRATDVERDLRLMGALDTLAAQLHLAYPGTQIGFAGGPVVTVAEHGALTRGIVLSSVITFVLVAFVLFAYLRSLRILALLTANIVAATLIAIGLAAVTVGHLNAATAFLGAIIAGNGVNYGILLVARYLEERRTSEPRPALAAA